MCAPHRLEHRPLLGVLLDVALKARRELTDAGANVGIPIAGRHQVEWLLDARDEEPLLAPGESREECRARPEREGDVRRWEERGPPEELDPLADPRHRTISEDAEHAAIPDDAVDSKGRVHRHAHAALCLPCSIHASHEVALSLL